MGKEDVIDTNDLINFYRIKTRKEFIYQYGGDWRFKVHFNMQGRMDSIIGLPLNNLYIIQFSNKKYKIKEIEDPSHMVQICTICDTGSSWIINSTMIKPRTYEKLKDKSLKLW